MHDGELPEELAKWTRRFAIECNNRSWELAELPKRTPPEDAEMLHAAHAAAFHWGKVGTERHQARALMLLGHVHALLGNGPAANAYATRSFAYIQSHDSPPWEAAFAHAVLANAAAAAGDKALHAKHYELAGFWGGVCRIQRNGEFSRQPTASYQNHSDAVK